MTTTERTEYNRAYYLKNRERILAKTKQSKAAGKGGSNVVALYDIEKPIQKKPVRGSWSRWLRVLQLLFLLTLLAAINYFLLTESAKFYIETEGDRLGGFLKAFILEGSAVALCLFKPRRKWARRFNMGLVVLIYCFSVWVVSGSVLLKARADQRAFEFQRDSIRDLKAEIENTEKFRDQLRGSNRITLAGSYDTQTQVEKALLGQLKKNAINAHSGEDIQTIILLSLALRILVIFSNWMLINLLKARQRPNTCSLFQ